MSHPTFTVREGSVQDIPVLARHRVAMFRDMGQLAPAREAALAQATAKYLEAALPNGEYLAWLALVDSAVIGGAGVQLRRILPRPASGGDALEFGPEAIVLNVYVEAEWRRRGIARSLMHVVLDALRSRGIRRIVLHPSADGRGLYESLGFVATQEMKLD